MQVAHFLEADLRPWAAALAAALFPPDAAQQRPTVGTSAAAAAAAVSSAAHHARAWQCLEAVRPLDGVLRAVLRASTLSKLPLLEQLPRTPAEWQPALISVSYTHLTLPTKA